TWKTASGSSSTAGATRPPRARSWSTRWIATRPATTSRSSETTHAKKCGPFAGAARVTLDFPDGSEIVFGGEAELACPAGGKRPHASRKVRVRGSFALLVDRSDAAVVHHVQHVRRQAQAFQPLRLVGQVQRQVAVPFQAAGGTARHELAPAVVRVARVAVLGPVVVTDGAVIVLGRGTQAVDRTAALHDQVGADAPLVADVVRTEHLEGV